jgi:hypothetical protein
MNLITISLSFTFSSSWQKLIFHICRWTYVFGLSMNTKTGLNIKREIKYRIKLFSTWNMWKTVNTWYEKIFTQYFNVNMIRYFSWRKVLGKVFSTRRCSIIWMISKWNAYLEVRDWLSNKINACCLHLWSLWMIFLHLNPWFNKVIEMHALMILRTMNLKVDNWFNQYDGKWLCLLYVITSSYNLQESKEVS